MANEDFLSLLKDEMKPALGVTEPGAIALACASAYKAIGGELKEIELVLDEGIFKNAYSCAIPGTDDLGNEMSAILGVIAGKPELELEVLKYIDEEDIKAAEKLRDSNIVKIKVLRDLKGIHIDSKVETDLGWGRAVIEGKHSNIVLVETNKKVIFKKQYKTNDKNAEGSFNIKEYKLSDLINFVDNVPKEDIEFTLEAIKVNEELAKSGMNGAGMNAALGLSKLLTDEVISEDVILHGQMLTGYAIDARVGGVAKEAMSISGSGSHGIIATMPLLAVAKKYNIDDDKLSRAIALSFLITIYIKEYSGRLSAFCGCAIAAGTGASVGIVYMLGGSIEQITYTINNMAANITGMICDGGNYGCSLKAITATNAAMMSAFFALKDISIPNNFGIVGQTPEETMINMGKIASPGMLETENTILDIMMK